jgi:hypothetical protein
MEPDQGRHAFFMLRKICRVKKSGGSPWALQLILIQRRGEAHQVSS